MYQCFKTLLIYHKMIIIYIHLLLISISKYYKSYILWPAHQTLHKTTTNKYTEQCLALKFFGH